MPPSPPAVSEGMRAHASEPATPGRESPLGLRGRRVPASSLVRGEPTGPFGAPFQSGSGESVVGLRARSPRQRGR